MKLVQKIFLTIYQIGEMIFKNQQKKFVQKIKEINDFLKSKTKAKFANR